MVVVCVMVLAVVLVVAVAKLVWWSSTSIAMAQTIEMVGPVVMVVVFDGARRQEQTRIEVCGWRDRAIYKQTKHAAGMQT